jgi:Bacterial PH domain
MIEDIIRNILILIAVTFLINYLTRAGLRSKPTVDPATGASIYTYVRGTKILMLIGIILPVFMGAVSLSLYRGGDSDYSVWLIICLIFAAMTAWALLEVFVVRLIVSEEGITSVSPWTGRRFFRWDEIEQIRYSKFSRWYVIAGPARKKIYASEYLNGFGHLSAEFSRRIPQGRWKHN